MIYLSTGRFEIMQYKEKHVDTIENLVEQAWLCRYPRYTIIMNNLGNEFPGHSFEKNLIKNEYKIKPKCATTDNPQANSTLERIHQVLANLVRTSDLQNNYVEEYDTWSGILVATAFIVCIMYHTTLQATPDQLVFDHDMMLDISFISDWEDISRCKNN